jgi:putative spermidine/putrescine transport system ATP-binding protein
MTATALSLDRITRHFGNHDAVADVSLDVAPGELIVLLGPSGCGKTTTLRMIAGFLQPSSGDIRLDNRSVLPLPPYQREMGIVFQSYALFPHLTVVRNVAFGLEMRRLGAEAIRARAAEMLRLTKLDAFADRLPRQLSGGQQQRVALARALAIHPKVLLLDEPLSNLDAALRLELAREIRLLQRDRGITTVMVTHDQAEAMAMADRLVVMRDGRMEQIGRQEDLYERPATPFVAGFIGGANLVAGNISCGRLCANEVTIRLAGDYPAASHATLAIRPECLHIAPTGGASRVEGEVEICAYLGAVVEHVVRLGHELRIVVRGPGLGPAAVPRHPRGTAVALNWSATEERLFNAAGQPHAFWAGSEVPEGEKEWIR